MSKKKPKPSEEEIDEIVASHANDDSAWEEPIQVKRPAAESFSLPADLAARAAFLARLHHARVDEWLRGVIQERVELEEASFAEVKRSLAKDDKAALEVRVSYRDSSLRKKLEIAHSSDDYALIFAKQRPGEIANNLGIRVMEHYCLKVREATGVEKKIVEKALKNLERALEIKTGY